MRKNIFTKIAAVAAATVLAVTALPALVSDTHAEDDEYSYVYAGLTWQEYWANEGVYNAGDVTSSNEKDTKGEYDKGAFDTVTRATTNHGLHRGSYQCMATIDTEDGKKYELAGWSSDGKQMILTDGTQLSYNRGTITNADGTKSKLSSYEVTGIKYVPVKVKTSDLADFEQHYRVVKNGEKLYGGFGENKLSSYEYTAAVNADTNGLKTAVKNADGTYSFSARQTGNGKSFAEQDISVAANITSTVTDANIVKVKEPASEDDKAKLSAAIAAADALNEADYTAESWGAMKLEYEEAVDALAIAEYKADVDEATEHLMAAINALVKADADTPSGSEEPDNTDDSSVEDVPTGDANNMMAYLAAALLALTAGAAVTCRRKIKNVR